MKKAIISIVAVLMLCMIISSVVFETRALTIDYNNPDPYKRQDASADNSGITGLANIIVWMVRTIGTGISVVVLSVIGIKYIMGSVEEKAEYKQTMWPYIVGAILIFAGSSVVNVIYLAFNQ